MYLIGAVDAFCYARLVWGSRQSPCQTFRTCGSEHHEETLFDQYLGWGIVQEIISEKRTNARAPVWGAGQPYTLQGTYTVAACYPNFGTEVVRVVSTVLTTQ